MTILKYVRDVIYMMYEEIQKIKHLREVTFVPKIRKEYYARKLWVTF